MSKKKLSKLLALYLPYILMGLASDQLWVKHGGWPWARNWATKSYR